MDRIVGTGGNWKPEEGLISLLSIQLFSRKARGSVSEMGFREAALDKNDLPNKLLGAGVVKCESFGEMKGEAI